MIVNINQCASTYDETLHVMKFSAVAKEVLCSALNARKCHAYDFFFLKKGINVLRDMFQGKMRSLLEVLSCSLTPKPLTFDCQVVQVIQPRSLEVLTPRLIGRDGKPLLNNEVLDGQVVNDYLTEEELLDGGDEADMSILPQEVRFVIL